VNEGIAVDVLSFLSVVNAVAVVVAGSRKAI